MIKLQPTTRGPIQGSLAFEFEPSFPMPDITAPITTQWENRWLNISGISRQEMIAPFMYYNDQERLVELVHNHLSRYMHAGGTNGNVLKFAEDKSFTNIFGAIRALQGVIPDHLIADIYNLYYYKPTAVSFCPINPSNKGKFLLLQMVNDAALKIVTTGNSIHTTIFVVEICMALVRTIIDQFNKEQIKKMADSLRKVNNNPNRSSTGGTANKNKDTSSQPPTEKDTSRSILEELVQALAGDQLDEALATAKKSAFNKIAELTIAGIDLRDMGNQAGIDPEELLKYIDRIRLDIKKLNINGQNIKHITSKIVHQSLHHFAGKVQFQDTPFLDTDTLEELEDMELLHPAFRNALLTEIAARERRYCGRLNVYVDISQSMENTIILRNPYTNKVSRMPAILFVKAVLLKMRRMHILSKIIPFGSDVKQPILSPTELDILLLEPYCGTSINNVIDHCDTSGENALVLTDCQDYIREYSRHVFIVGTPGASFSLMGAAGQLQQQKQLWVFDPAGMQIQAA